MKKILILLFLIVFIILLTSCEGAEDAAYAKDEEVVLPRSGEYSVLPGKADEAEEAEEGTQDKEEAEDAVNAEPADILSEYISAMDSGALAGQMVFAACPELGAAEFIAKYQPGGLILFGRNINGKTAEELAGEIELYQENAVLPLFIGADEEGGDVVRISSNTQIRASRFSSPRKLITNGGSSALRQEMKEKAALLTSLGVNVNLAPVCDLTTEETSFMYSRSVPGDADEAAEYIFEMTSEMESGGLSTVLKHFPGYGDNGDTHTSVITDERAAEEFEDGFKTFAAGIEAGSGAVLVSHNIINAFDPEYPASLSNAVIDLMREKLGGDIVAITDDLQMDAVSSRYSLSEAAVLAVNAGEDMLICWDAAVAIGALSAAIENGEIPRARAEEAVRRILDWKVNAGLIETESLKIY